MTKSADGHVAAVSGILPLLAPRLTGGLRAPKTGDTLCRLCLGTSYGDRWCWSCRDLFGYNQFTPWPLPTTMVVVE